MHSARPVIEHDYEETLAAEVSGGGELKLLAIGFLPPPVGGVSVSFKLFCDLASERNDVRLHVINVSGMNRRGRHLRDALVLLRDVWRHARDADVVKLYCASNQIQTLGLAILTVCRLRKKPLVLRSAGGGKDYRSQGPIAGRVADFVVRRSRLFLLQTRRSVDLCHQRQTCHATWYPTSRIVGIPISSRLRCRRFVFVGQILPIKGIGEFIAAARRLPEDAIAHVYGPLLDGSDGTIFEGVPRVVYKGVLEPREVTETIRNYDVLVLPSKAQSEGYPGAILEALSMGMPVIATPVGGIPEIVDDTCGLLVEPGNPDELLNAMNSLYADDALYRKLCHGAMRLRRRFSADYWVEWLIRRCAELTRVRT